MKAKNNKLKMFLKVVLLGAVVYVGTIASAATYTYTWQAVDGNWDGNISDSAHWKCDTADRPASPETTSDKLSMKIPAGVQARITIDKDLSVGSFFSESGSHVTLVSIDKADTGEMTHLQLSSGLYIRDGATLVLDHAKITNTGDNFSVSNLGEGKVMNGSLLTNKNFHFRNTSGKSAFEVSGKSTVSFSNFYIGGGNRFVINDSTVHVGKLLLGTDSNTLTSEATSLCFMGDNPQMLFDDGPSENGRRTQACVANSKSDGDVLNFDFIVPEDGFNSTPITIVGTDRAIYLFADPLDCNTANKGKFRFNVSDESPLVLNRRKIEQKLVEWRLNSDINKSEEGFNFSNIITGNLPGKARQAEFNSGIISASANQITFAYSALLDCRPTGFKVIVR